MTGSRSKEENGLERDIERFRGTGDLASSNKVFAPRQNFSYTLSH